MPSKPKAKTQPLRSNAMSRKQRKNRSKTTNKLHPHIFLHPRLNTLHMTTPNLSATPYTVVRDKVILPIVPSTAAGTNTVLLLGCYQVSSGNPSISPSYGVYGSGTGVPGGAGEIQIPSSLITGATLGRARLHRLAARICCTGSTTAGSAVPDGKIYYGTLRGIVDRTQFASFNAIATYAQTRNEVVERTNYETFAKPAHLVTSPNDYLQWETFQVIGSTPSNLMFATPDLNMMVIVIPPTVNAINIDVQIDAEWTVEYTVDPVLQSTHRRHMSVPDSLWHEARGFLSDHGGQLSEAALAGAAVVAAPEITSFVGGRMAYSAAGRIASRALPALGY